MLLSLRRLPGWAYRTRTPKSAREPRDRRSRPALDPESILLDTMFDLPSLEGVEEVVISKEVVEGTTPPLYVYAERAKGDGLRGWACRIRISRAPT